MSTADHVGIDGLGLKVAGEGEFVARLRPSDDREQGVPIEARVFDMVADGQSLPEDTIRSRSQLGKWLAEHPDVDPDVDGVQVDIVTGVKCDVCGYLDTKAEFNLDLGAQTRFEPDNPGETRGPGMLHIPDDGSILLADDAEALLRKHWRRRHARTLGSYGSDRYDALRRVIDEERG